MCDAMAVGLAAKGVGTLIQGTAAQAQGRATRAADYRSADFAEKAAADAIEAGNLKDLSQAMHGAAVVATQRVAMSGTGVDINTGGSLATQLGTQAVNEVDRATVRRNARLHAYGLTAQAQGDRQRGENAAVAGDNAMLGTFLGGMGGLLGDAGKVVSDKISAGVAAKATEKAADDFNFEGSTWIAGVPRGGS